MATLADLVSEIDLASLFERYGVVTSEEAACPLCRDEQGFSYDDEGDWQCVACNQQGSLLAFIERLEECSPSDAYTFLHNFANIPVEKQAEPPPEDEFDAVSTEAIYTAFVEMSHLTDEHREHLRRNRGFSDEIIDELKFRSGGEHNREVINRLQDKFDPADLLNSRMFYQPENSKDVVPSRQLLDDEILIPYLYRNGSVYHLRRHKMGFRDTKPQIYCRYLLQPEQRHIVLTEAEFKAAACYQWGIPTISIPGVSSFGKVHYQRLVEFLKEHKVERVTIIFDNEVKDNPAYSNYKEQVEDRYDTQFWAYLMAYKIQREGIKTRIGTLPDDWMENGKIDLDMALAQGKTREDIIAVARDAKTHAEYLDSLDENARVIVNRKRARHFERSRVTRRHNKYYIREKDGFEKQVSNFIMDITASFHTSEGIVRSVEFVNEYSERSEPFFLEPKVMVSLTDFKGFCLSKGNYVYEGTGSELTEIWKFELLRDTGEVIRMPEQIGQINSNFWLFGNLAIKDGKTYHPDKNGVIWVDGTGYKPQSLIHANNTQDDAPTDAGLPTLHDKEDADIEEIAYRLRSSIGGYEAWAGLGWIAATVFSRDIFQAYKAIPILFVHGAYEAGKTTFLRWLMQFFGIEHYGANIQETTQNYIMRALAYWSSMPVWFDEFRNERNVQSKSGFFRSAYNRQASGKGVKAAFGARGYTVRATLALSGQEIPQDAAFASRLAVLRLTSQQRDRKQFDWLNQHSYKFSAWVYHLITHYDIYRDQVLAAIRDLKLTLVQTGITDRTAENWAIIGGAFWATVRQDESFVRWLRGAASEVQEVSRSEEMVSQFWADLTVLQGRHELGQAHMRVHNAHDGHTHLYLWFEAAYSVWAESYRRRTGNNPFDKTSLRQQIQEQDYCLQSVKVSRINGTPRRCMVLDVEKAPEPIQELAEYIASKN